MPYRRYQEQSLSNAAAEAGRAFGTDAEVVEAAVGNGWVGLAQGVAMVGTGIVILATLAFYMLA